MMPRESPADRSPTSEAIACRFCGAQLRARMHARCILLLISSEGVDVGEDAFSFCPPCGRLVGEALQTLSRVADAGARRGAR